MSLRNKTLHLLLIGLCSCATRLKEDLAREQEQSELLAQIDAAKKYDDLAVLYDGPGHGNIAATPSGLPKEASLSNRAPASK